MSETQDNSAARERVLDAAERLFREQGYSAVSMRDIARALGIRQASLYYHVPDGKEQLFIEVTERSLRRHQLGFIKMMAEAEPDLQSQLEKVAEWFMVSAPLKLISLFETDINLLSTSSARNLTNAAYRAVFEPIEEIFRDAQRRGDVKQIDTGLLSGVFVSIMEGIALLISSGHLAKSKNDATIEMIEVLLEGLRSK